MVEIYEEGGQGCRRRHVNLAEVEKFVQRKIKTADTIICDEEFINNATCHHCPHTARRTYQLHEKRELEGIMGQWADLCVGIATSA